MTEVKNEEGDSDTNDITHESFRSVDKERCKTETKDYRKWVIISTAVVATVAVVWARVYWKTSSFTSSTESLMMARDVDERVMSLFVDFDTNMDGAIDLGEFAPLANRMLDRKETKDKQLSVQQPQPEESWDFSGELITIKSYFTPLVLSTMSKYNVPSSLGLDYPLEGLKSWKTAALSQATFPVSAFLFFLPHSRDERLVGEIWYLIHPMITRYGPGLSNNRYVPPFAQGKVAILYRLLAMFHPRPFLMTRFGPQGTIACVRAQNKDYLDIVFRMHAEFQLNVEPLLPFWFTPAQYLGNIVIKRDGSHVRSFHLFVPSNKSLNVDMEWMVGQKSGQQAEPGNPDERIGENNEVDIGYMPRMELVSVEPSQHLINADTTGSRTENVNGERVDSDIHWDLEISLEQAYKELELKMYPFKKVPYLSFRDAFSKAKAERKLVHHILLWGALDDQSC